MTPRRRSEVRWPGWCRRFHRDEGGQLVFLIVASVVAFVAGAALIINSGSMVARRMEAQNAADAAAVSASAVLARGMNVISLNNVAMTEMLAISVVLRALQDTWKEGRAQARAILTTLEWLCPSLSSSPNPYIAALAIPCFTYQAAVEGSEAYFSLHLQTSGWLIDYSTDPQSGVLWQAMETLSLVSGAAAVGFPILAFSEADRIGRENAAEGVAVAPILPRLPVERGAFGDLCHPTRVGSPSGYPQGFRRGYHPLLAPLYRRFDEGPLLVYRELADGTALRWAFRVMFRESPLRQNVDREFGRWCQGSPGGGYSGTRATPAPYLVRGMGRATNTSRTAVEAARDDLDYFAAVWRSNRAAFIPTQFRDRRERSCAYGQARVFNATSFDLFTPDWRAKLVKADMLDEGIEAAAILGLECDSAAVVPAAPLLNFH